MVSLCTANQDIYNIKQLIRTKAQHSFIESYIKEPMINMEKVVVLNHLYHHQHMSVTEKQQYMLTIMLIQIALDTHEEVPTETETNRDDIEKQLSVLAGDYYSGLYYFYLAKLEDIEMINMLANTIKRINEYKMILYYKEIDCINDLKTVIKQIESLLFTNTASYLNESLIVPILEEWFLLNRLMKEKELILNDKTSLFIDCMQEISTTNRYHSMINIIEHEITQTTYNLKHLLNDMPLHLIGLKSYIINSLVKKPYKVKRASLVEEG